MTDGAAAPSPVIALFDRVAADYETVGPAFFDHFGGLLVAAAGVRTGDRVVDLAAGSGAVSHPALTAAGTSGSLIALDLAPGMVDRLRTRLAADGHPDATALVGDAGDPGLEPAAFDVVLCGFGLFFLPAPQDALARWAGLLRPGGRLGVSTWGREDEVFAALRDELAALGVESRPRGQTYDDPGVLRSALAGAGLHDVAVTTVSLDLELRDVDELLAWGRTNGARAWLDQLDARASARLRDALVDRWPGSVPMSWQAHLATGVRPPG